MTGLEHSDRVPAGRTWASAMAYSRAVRRGPLIEVSGATATAPDGTAIHPGDAGRQAEYVLGAVVDAVERLGGTVDDIVRTRIFLTDLADFTAVAAAHDAVLHEVAPASAAVQVAGLLLPELRVEIEATAYLCPDEGWSG